MGINNAEKKYFQINLLNTLNKRLKKKKIIPLKTVNITKVDISAAYF